MNYRPKPKLKHIVLASIGSVIFPGCYEFAADLIGVAGGYSNDSKVRDASGVVSRGLSRTGERARTKAERRDDLEFEIEREKRLKEVYNGPSKSEEPEYSGATKDALDKVFGGEKAPDYTVIINKIEQRLEENPFDYERNIRIVDNALDLEGITLDDKSRLLKLLKNTTYPDKITFRNRIIKMKRGIFNIPNKREYIEGKIKISDFIIGRREIDMNSRIVLMSFSMKLIPFVIRYLPQEETTVYLERKIEMLKKVEDTISLSQKERVLLDKYLRIMNDHLERRPR